MRMPACTSEQISCLYQSEDRRRQEVRSDITGGLLLLVSPCVPLFPGFYDKNCSHLPFLAPGILLLGLLLLLLLSRFSRVQLCATSQMAAHQDPPSMDSPGKNTGVGCHCLLHSFSISVFKSSLTPEIATDAKHRTIYDPTGR